MRLFNRAIVCAAALVLALGLSACGSSGASSSAASASGASDAGASSASVSATAASSEAAASASAASADATSASSASADSGTVTVDEPLAGHDTMSEEESSASAAEPSASAAAETATEAEAPGFDFVDECTDEHGNVTLYSLTELKGWQLETLLDQQGYKWNESDLAWVRQEDGAQFSAYKQTGTYTQQTYDEMNEKGGAIVAIGFNIVAGYKDAEAALKGNAKCVVEDSYFKNGEGIAIFYGPSMKEYLAIISPYSESTTQFMIFSKEAVGSGMLDQAMGEQVGGSFQEVWKAVTGQDSYGH